MYHVLATNGHTRLGGSTLVERLVSHCNGNECIGKDLCSVRRACEEAKNKLSTEDETEIIFSGKNVVLSREKYNEIIAPFIEKTMTCVKNALMDADLEIDEIDKIILVGGCTYTPLISDTLERFFGKKVNRDINPMEAGESRIIFPSIFHLISYFLNYILCVFLIFSGIWSLRSSSSVG